MSVSSDFKELLSAFNAARVRFIVVGAYAVIHHTEPRYTKDLDVWVEPSPANARRVLSALRAFGAPTADLGVEDLCDPDIVYQIGVAPVRVDILTRVPGLRFATASRNAVRTKFDGVPIRVLSLSDAIRAKRAAGRPQDLLDLERLRRARADRRGRRR
jgi:predicted nucleotidyltransferase